MKTPSPGLLVSVRSATEALAALEGGAALIDVKEPRAGPLGRAALETVCEVVRVVGGQRPVSAALGELALEPDLWNESWPGLAFVKWGLAGLGGRDWRARLRLAAERVAHVTLGCQLVTVAYADWRAAKAPLVEEIVAFARSRPGGVLLLDTYGKEPPSTLLDFLTVEQIVALCRCCHEASVRVALAGSLKAPQIAQLRAAAPDWFAVRGAACAGDCRDATVSTRKVRALNELLQQPHETVEMRA